MNRRRTLAGTAVVGAGAVTAAALGLGLPGAEGTGGQQRGTLPPATATVTRQTLVDTQIQSGELGYGDTTAVTSRLSGTVTALPAVGAILKRGSVLCRVDDAPVVLLYGPLPAYRRLAPGVEGADVKQFERNLRALGYRGFTVDDTYSSATAEAVEEWQDDLGLAETGTVELGRIGYAPGPVRVDARTAAVGDAAQPGKTLVSLTGTARLVTVELEMSDQRLARKDAKASVELPDGTTIPGTITEIESVVEPGEGQQEDTTALQATIAVDKVPATLGQASVQVELIASQRPDVLTVPVAALLALAEGGYGVQVVEGAATRIVAVETGLFADGRVEVSGAGLAENLTVGVPS
jgi:peptidoglycan hydrolase-like protein with peptidoglycan-binding domain